MKQRDIIKPSRPWRLAALVGLAGMIILPFSHAHVLYAAETAKKQAPVKPVNQSVPQNAGWSDEAISKYQKAAENGDKDAQYSLGAYYWYGKRNLDEATKWWRKAALQGLAAAQYELGTNYVYSLQPSEAAEGLEWLHKAAAQGDARAMFEFGCQFDDPLKGRTEYEVAAGWYRKSAERGFAPAQKFLSNMYAKGEGVEKSWEDAYFWGCLSVQCFNGHVFHYNPYVMAYPSRDLSNPLEAESHLWPSEIQAIKKKARQWQPEKDKP